MKPVSKLVILALICACCQLVSPAYAQRKKEQKDNESGLQAAAKNGKPLVLVASDAEKGSEWTKELIASALQNAIVQSGRFTILSDSARALMKKELKFSQSDLANPDKA